LTPSMTQSRFQTPARVAKKSAQITVHLSADFKADLIRLSKILQYPTQNLFYLHLLEEGVVVAQREADKKSK
jgi:hypothetical protein